MPSLELESLHTHHLGPVNLHLEADCTTLTGPSGSGKTLLLRAIADLDPHRGQVRLDGTAQSELPGPQWRRRVGYLPAEAHWWEERVGAHFGPEASALLQAVGFGTEVLEWEVSRLSSGERQRLALARLLVLEPQALLLDEPTANLDPENRQRVEALIADFARRTGALVLWVTHDPEQRRRVGSRHFRIDGSTLVEESL
jgi:ABC-type iron transport system FetAB ATPase subunit